MVLAVVWLLVAIAAALLLGAVIRIADQRAPATDQPAGLPDDLTVADILRQRRTTVPTV